LTANRNRYIITMIGGIVLIASGGADARNS
jgi:hypothetical protein